MKFNKQLDAVKNRYKCVIPIDQWFEYKKIKKLLKNASYIIKNKIKYNPYAVQVPVEDCCCVCLENDKLMKMFCCNNVIHHVCLIQVLTSSVMSCPMCRSNLQKVIAYEQDQAIQQLDATILSLISVIHLNINKIEDTYKSRVISNAKLMKIYSYWNYMAVIKICKKIEKQLHLKDLRTHFMNIMQKKNILIEDRPSRSKIFRCLKCMKDFVPSKK